MKTLIVLNVSIAFISILGIVWAVRDVHKPFDPDPEHQGLYIVNPPVKGWKKYRATIAQMAGSVVALAAALFALYLDFWAPVA